MKILVTGANGHLGANLVAALLEAGHTVRASVRSLSDRAKYAHVQALGPVELVEAGLDRPQTLRAAMDGMETVFHAAAVYSLYAPGQEDAIIRASIDGIDAALRAAKDAGVAKIIVTSSIVTLPLTQAGAPASTELDWASDLRVPYIKAKTRGEQRAWELAKSLDLNLATVLPGAFAGPGFQRNTPTIDFIETIMNGAMQFGAPPMNYPYVDVRDVVRAHLMVLDRDVQGRYLAVNDRLPTMTEIALAMHAIDPSIPKPLMTLPAFVMPVLPWLDGLNSRITGTARSMTPDLAGTLRGKVWNASSAKIRRELGWAPRIGLRQSLADTIAVLRARTAA